MVCKCTPCLLSRWLQYVDNYIPWSLLQEMKIWLTSLVKDIEEEPLQNVESQITAAFFIIVCMGKTFKVYQQLTNPTILSLIRMLMLHPESDKKCPTYNFIKDHLLEKILGYTVYYRKAYSWLYCLEHTNHCDSSQTCYLLLPYTYRHVQCVLLSYVAPQKWLNTSATCVEELHWWRMPHSMNGCLLFHFAIFWRKSHVLLASKRNVLTGKEIQVVVWMLQRKKLPR